MSALICGSFAYDTIMVFKDRFKNAKAQVLERFEREYLLNLLRTHGGNLTRAARQAGLVRHHLRELCRRHGIPAGADTSQE